MSIEKLCEFCNLDFLQRNSCALIKTGQFEKDVIKDDVVLKKIHQKKIFKKKNEEFLVFWIIADDKEIINLLMEKVINTNFPLNCCLTEEDLPNFNKVVLEFFKYYKD